MSTNESTNYCTECHGRPHAPWCSQYVEPQIDQTATRCCDECDYSDEQEREEQELPAPCYREEYDKLSGALTDEDVELVIGAIPLQALPDPPALRNTRSIAHHAEMVEEQARKERESCLKCGHNNMDTGPEGGTCEELILGPIPQGGMVYCNCQCVFVDQKTRQRLLDAITADKAIDALGDDVRQQRLIVHSTFDDAWNTAPKPMRRVTEIEAAEFFYYAGRRDRETEMLRDVNETLRGVAERIGREGKK